MAKEEIAALERCLERREPITAFLRRLEDLAVVLEAERAAHGATSTSSLPAGAPAQWPLARGVRDGDHVATPVAVTPVRGGSSRRPGGTCPPAHAALRGEHRPEAADAHDLAGRQRPRLCREEADRERLLESGERDLVQHLVAERLAQRDLDEIDSDGVPDEVGHLPSGNARGDLHHRDATVRRRDQLRERDRVAEAECAYRLDCRPLGERELIAVDGRRVHVDPADAEADSRGTETVRERHESRLQAAGDHDPVHLDAFDEPFEDRLAGRGLGEGLGQIALELGTALDAEHCSLASRSRPA